LPAREVIDHTAGRPQGWPRVDEDLSDWVELIATRFGQLEGVAAVFLHGSLSTGSFFRPKSDLDLLVVVEHALSDSTRRSLAVDLVELFHRRPILGGIEVSAVTRLSLEILAHPMPYEFHFSEKWIDHVQEGGSGPQGTDADLAAHCTMARARGVALVGPPPASLIGEVPHDTFLDAVMDDARWIMKGGIVESPFYGVLNLCRVLQHVLDEPELPPSKEEGAMWALASLPAGHRPVVAAALECYRARAPVDADLRRVHGHRWVEEPLLAFAAYAESALRRAL